MKEKYGKRKNYLDININEVEGFGEIDREFIKIGFLGGSDVEEGSGVGVDTFMFLKVKDFIIEIYDRDIEIFVFYEMFFDMEDYLERIEGKMVFI